MRSSKDLQELLQETSSEDLVINLVGLQRGHLRRYRELHQLLSESRARWSWCSADAARETEADSFSFTSSGVNWYGRCARG